MAISDRDIKKLWGLSGGRCAYTGCNCDCLPFLNDRDPTVIGEMAHVIARSPDGPRGDGISGGDTYENLLLLCPTHHTLVDKAPHEFPADTLQHWKTKHEEAVRHALSAPAFVDRRRLFRYIADFLAENKACWSAYGPESDSARVNPVSNLHRLWDFRKLAIIVPNNALITDAVKRNKSLLGREEYQVAATFMEHAAGFERNCHERFDGIPRFPDEFERLINE